MRILVTCFEPFGCDAVNASREAVALLPDAVGGHRLEKCVLPVSFVRTPEALARACSEVSPDMILMTGQAPRTAVCLERIAVNWAISAGPDNDGLRAAGERIYPGAPDGLFTPLPVDSLASALSGRGLPAKVSNSAGTFVCNRLYYEALHRCAGIPSLFVHVPLTPAQADARGPARPSLPATVSMAVLRELISMLGDCNPAV